MILITDSNLIISALITPNGAIASIIKAKHNFQFIAPEDVFFIALHLHTGHKIWSGDEKLKKGLPLKVMGIFLLLLKNSKNTYTKKDHNQLVDLPI